MVGAQGLNSNDNLGVCLKPGQGLLSLPGLGRQNAVLGICVKQFTLKKALVTLTCPSNTATCEILKELI